MHAIPTQLRNVTCGMVPLVKRYPNRCSNRAQRGGPNLLRTESEPAGVATLQGEDLNRVQAANQIQGLEQFC